MSTVAIFGAAAFYQVTQAEADAAMEQVIAAGVNQTKIPCHASTSWGWRRRSECRFMCQKG